MITNSKLRVSLVIPVYNEESYLALCLQAIAQQTVRPFEVIVVDNNSTDNTVAIARQFSFVRLLREPRQGVVYAREHGFNAARGEIVGRIDGDTILDPSWIEKTQEVFSDPTVSVATGKVRYHELSLARLANAIDLAARRYLAWRLGRNVATQGANMALRRSTWDHIRGDMCHRRGMHEDYDIAIHATKSGCRVVFDERMVASLGYRLADTDYRQFREYCYIGPRTYFQHGLKSGREMYPVVWLALPCYLPLKLLRSGYDGQLDRFSLKRLFTNSTKPRVNPATYGDF
jgi:glycosyltransferase involved in cell wall biosynthesis